MNRKNDAERCRFDNTEWTIRDGFQTLRTTSVAPWRSCPVSSPGKCAPISRRGAPTAAATDPCRGRQPGRAVRHRHQRSTTFSGLRDQPGHSTATPPTSRRPESSIRPQTHRPAARSGHTSVSGWRTDGEAVQRSRHQPDDPAPGTHQDRHPASPTRQTVNPELHRGPHLSCESLTGRLGRCSGACCEQRHEREGRRGDR